MPCTSSIPPRQPGMPHARQPTCTQQLGHPTPAGPPKQFAVSVGIVFSMLIVVLQFCGAWQVRVVVGVVVCCERERY